MSGLILDLRLEFSSGGVDAVQCCCRKVVSAPHFHPTGVVRDVGVVGGGGAEVSDNHFVLRFGLSPIELSIVFPRNQQYDLINNEHEHFKHEHLTSTQCSSTQCLNTPSRTPTHQARHKHTSHTSRLPVQVSWRQIPTYQQTNSNPAKMKSELETSSIS